jgi:hypothetical protein
LNISRRRLRPLGDEGRRDVGEDAGSGIVDPSGGDWDGSPCSYAKDFVEFVYRDERERRR